VTSGAASRPERRTKRLGVGHDGVAGKMQRLAGVLPGVGVAGATGILDDDRDDAEVGGVAGAEIPDGTGPAPPAARQRRAGFSKYISGLRTVFAL
jgi:hypothetical protein